MQLYIIRHADAARAAISDFERKLTETGHKQSKKLAEFMSDLEIKPDIIFTSPLARAVETAEYLDKKLSPPNGMHADDRLACGMVPEEACEILWAQNPDATIILVGHEPDLSRLGAYFTGMTEAYSLEMKKAACLAIDLDHAAPSGGILRWLITPRIINCID
jgi:phosphohistidine phosphatase